MSERISVECPSCRARLRAPLKLIGRSRPCPACRVVVAIRPSVPDEAEPVLIMDDDEPRPSRWGRA
jgi:hypothetical protein